MLTLGLPTQELERLDVLMREIIDIDVEIRTHEKTLKDLHQRVVAGEEIVRQFSALHVPLTYPKSSERRARNVRGTNAGDPGQLQQKDY